MSRSNDDLIQSYLDDQLDAVEAAAFVARLQTDPELAEQVIQQARDEAIIAEWAKSHRAARTTDRDTTPSRRPLRFPRRAGIAATAVALAASVLIAVIVWWPVANPAGNSIAELADVAGEVYVVAESGEATAARAGTRLEAGQGLRTGGEGSFAIVVADTTRLELGTDTSIRLSVGPAVSEGQARRKVHLEQGSVAAEVTRPLNPMLLTTPHGEALLESKSSFLSVPEGTRIEPEAGPVTFRQNNGQSVAVQPGWYAVALPSNPMVRQLLPTRQTKVRALIEEESGPALAAAISPDGRLLAVGCFDGSVKLYDTATAQLHRELKIHRQPVRCLAFSPDGQVLASAGVDRRVVLSDPQTGQEVGKLPGYRGAIDSLAFSPRGELLATGGTQGRELAEVRVWSVSDRREVANLEQHQSGVIAVAFSPDGALLATAGRDQRIHLIDLATFSVRRTLDGHRAPVNAIAFSPDGTSLVSGSRDRTVRLWDVAAGVQRSVLPAQASPVRALAFSPDGGLLAAADASVRLYDWTTGQERLILKGHKKQITAIVFAPDGRLIGTTSMDKTIRLWELMPEEPDPAG